jgi:hypothetical protein
VRVLTWPQEIDGDDAARGQPFGDRRLRRASGFILSDLYESAVFGPTNLAGLFNSWPTRICKDAAAVKTAIDTWPLQPAPGVCPDLCFSQSVTKPGRDARFACGPRDNKLQTAWRKFRRIGIGFSVGQRHLRGALTRWSLMNA